MKIPYNTIKPATHEGWLAERKKGIGASVAGAIMGVSKYNTPYTLWRNLVGIDPPVEENMAMRIGHKMEDVIFDLFEEEIGGRIIKNTKCDWLAVSKENPILRISPDAIFKFNGGGKGVLECKSSQIDYDEECLQNQHLDWFCQIQYQMHVLGIHEGYLGYLNIVSGKHWFCHVTYNEKFCRELIDNIVSFYENHVKPAKDHIEQSGWQAPFSQEQIYIIEQYAPEITNGGDVRKKFPSQTVGKSIDADAKSLDMVSEYALLNQQKKQITSRMDEIKDAIIYSMRDAESMVDKSGYTYATYRQNKPSVKFDEASFKEKHPEMYREFSREVQGARVLKIK